VPKRLAPVVRGCAQTREKAQQVSCALQVGALRRLIPHQYASSPRLKAVGERADFGDTHIRRKLWLSHDEVLSWCGYGYRAAFAALLAFIYPIASKI